MISFWWVAELLYNGKDRLLANFKKSLYFHFLVHLPNLIRIIIKARSLTFFTVVNPGFKHGGVTGYSKHNINKQFDSKYRAKSLFLEERDSKKRILTWMDSEEIDFPIILKPDIGERSIGVKYVINEHELEHCLLQSNSSTIVEEYIDTKEEYGLLYVRLPSEELGTITSFVRKKGITNKNQLHFDISKNSKEVEYEDLSPYITYDLVRQIDKVSKSVDGFSLGRYDIRANCINDIIEGNFKILELNSVASIPLHLYDPCIKLKSCYDFFHDHYNKILRIAENNKENGIEAPPLSTMLKIVFQTRKDFAKQ